MADNRKQFAAKGILYPLAGVNDNRAQHLMSASCRHDFQEVDALRAELVKEFTESTTTVMLSSEDFCQSDVDMDLVRRLVKSSEVRVVVYFRKADEFIQSIYNQMIKQPPCWGNVFGTMSEYLNSKGGDWFVFHRYDLVKRWAEAFGKENIIIRTYQEFPSVHGLAEDYINAIGLSMQDFRPPLNRRLNTSVNPLALELIRVAGRYSLTCEQKEKVVALATELAGNDRVDLTLLRNVLLTPEQRKTILDLAEPQETRLAQEYLGRDKLFTTSGC
jgi:hypothetical protein